MRKLAALAAATMMIATGASAEITAIDDKALSEWVSRSVINREIPADFHYVLPFSTSTGAFALTHGDLRRMGYIAESGVCDQACFGYGFWEGTPWTNRAQITDRKDIGDTPDLQRYMAADRVLLDAALIDGYVREGHKIGFRTVTAGGSLDAAALIGPYAFRVWVAGGYTPDAIPQEVVDISGMSRDQIYAELIRRMTDEKTVSPITWTNGDSFK